MCCEIAGPQPSGGWVCALGGEGATAEQQRVRRHRGRDGGKAALPAHGYVWMCGHSARRFPRLARRERLMRRARHRNITVVGVPSMR